MLRSAPRQKSGYAVSGILKQMHEVVIDEFDRHLGGEASPAFYRHLESCGACRAEVAELEMLSGMFEDLKPQTDAVFEPPPGFYNRLEYRIIEQRRGFAWGFFAASEAFFRRIAFASLLLLAGLGTVLVMRESSEVREDAAAIMAQHDHSPSEPESADRDRLLTALASYHE